jgi:hypothetical protein
MAWTQDQLDAIERAIASGTTRVKYKDREVQYSSLEDLMRVRQMMLADLQPGGTKTRYPSFDRDL